MTDVASSVPPTLRHCHPLHLLAVDGFEDGASLRRKSFQGGYFHLSASRLLFFGNDWGLAPPGKWWIHSGSTLLFVSKRTPSCSSSARLRSIGAPLPHEVDAPRVKPPSFRSDAITLCHGTSRSVAQPEAGTNGFFFMHCPTACADPLEPAARATSPYVVIRPGGTVRTRAKTRSWKSVSIVDGRKQRLCHHILANGATGDQFLRPLVALALDTQRVHSEPLYSQSPQESLQESPQESLSQSRSPT